MSRFAVTNRIAARLRAMRAGCGAVASVFALLAGLTAGTARPALAADAGCAALNGVETAGECQISGLHPASGAFTVGIKLHILDGGTIKTGAAGITLTLGAGLAMDAAAQIDADVLGCSPSSNTGGPVNITATAGDIDLAAGSSIHSNSCSAGAINITATPPSKVTIDGTVESIGSRTGDGTAGKQAPGGGPIFIKAGCVLTIGDNGIVRSQGKDPGADLVHLEGCSVSVFGLVESTGAGHAVPTTPPNSCSDVAPLNGTVRRNPTTRTGKPTTSTGCVEIWAGTTVLISSTDSHNGEVNADIGITGGSTGRGWIDILARGNVNIADGAGNDDGADQVFAVHANGGLMQNTDDAGLINIRSLTGDVVASGNAIQASSINAGGTGGEIHVEASNTITFDGATIAAQGDAVATGGFGKGGQIGTDATHGLQTSQPIRAYNGAISWQNGVGDVRPTGTNANLAAASRGIIVLKDCAVGPINVTGTTFPNSGLPNTVPTEVAGSCGPVGGGPVLPAYVTADTRNVFPSASCLDLCALPSKKGGTKFNDLAGDHVKDPGDPGLPNWEIRAYNSQNQYVASAFTDATGHYEFQLAAGTYTFCEVQQLGWTQTFPVAGANCTPLGANLAPIGYTVTLPQGGQDSPDFGNHVDAPVCPEDPNAKITIAVDDTGAAHGTVPVYTTVQAAYDAAPNGAVIGLFSSTTENVVLGGSKTLKITQCTTARVYALDTSKPVWTISSTGALTVVSPDAVGGSIGWLIQGDDNEVKSVRSTGASEYGIKITGSDNRVSFNSVTGSPVGIRIEGSGNDVRGGTVSGNYGNGVEIGSASTLNAFQTANVTGNGGNGIVVDGSGNTVASNGRVDSNAQNGILVTGANNTIKNNAAGSDKAVGNGKDGFRISGAGNLLQDNKANANLGNGFTVSSTATGTKLKNNQSNTSSSGGNKENAGYEYRLDAAVIDQGSNKADTIGTPKTSAPQKCPTFPAAGTLCE